MYRSSSLKTFPKAIQLKTRNSDLILIMWYLWTKNLWRKISVDVSDSFSPADFEKVKHFIFAQWDRVTYRNYDNSNLHYRFSNCDVYLGVDIGQVDIINDPEVPDFNEMTFVDWENDIGYCSIISFRSGDVKAEKAPLLDGMKENHVYVVEYYRKGLEKMKKKLNTYFIQMIKEVSGYE